MKQSFLFLLATVITITSFAADKGKHKKHPKKATRIEHTCPVTCPQTGCNMMKLN